jgi:hypothetical protein
MLAHPALAWTLRSVARTGLAAVEARANEPRFLTYPASLALARQSQRFQRIVGLANPANAPLAADLGVTGDVARRTYRRVR